MEHLPKIDIFSKTSESIRLRTLSGGFLSLLFLSIFLMLTVIEVGMFFRTNVEKELAVDTGLNQKLNINLDITFPKLPCSYLSLDAVDSAGEVQRDIDNNIFTERLDTNGRPIPSAEIARLELKIQEEIKKVPVPQNGNGCDACYGAESDLIKCCPTCESVREAYRDKGWAFTSSTSVAQCVNEGFSPRMLSQQYEGCRVRGKLTVAKVSGNVHVSPGRSIKNSHNHLHDTASLNFAESFNLTHTINHLSFGPDFPHRFSPLDGTSKQTDAPLSLFQYFIKVVPTRYISGSDEIESNQFSVTTHFQPMTLGAHDSEIAPGVFFLYDLSPIQVTLRETSQSWITFLTNLFGTAGGMFTVSTLLDWFLHNGKPNVFKKAS